MNFRIKLSLISRLHVSTLILEPSGKKKACSGDDESRCCSKDHIYCGGQDYHTPDNTRAVSTITINMFNRLVFVLSVISGSLLFYLIQTRLNEPHTTWKDTLFNTELDHYVDIDEPQLAARLSHAEKLWRQSVEDRKVMAQRMGDRAFPDGYLIPFNIWDLARPSFFCPHDLERIGSLGDGGKIVCGMSRYEKESPRENATSELIVYSLGVERDSRFEAAMLERTNARVWGYDYSVSSWAKDIKKEHYSRASFSKLGIGKVTDKSSDPPFYTIQDLMKENGHTYVDILKIDIEGAEFEALTSFINSVQSEHKRGDANPTLPVGQLLIEVHFKKNALGFNAPHDLPSWMKWWASLESMGMRAVSNEHNWIGDAVFGKPRFMEYTMINAADKERNKLLWT